MALARVYHSTQDNIGTAAFSSGIQTNYYPLQPFLLRPLQSLSFEANHFSHA